MASNADYANAAAFARRIRTIDAQIGWENRVAAGFELGRQLKGMELIRHANGNTHYQLPALVKHCADCQS